MFYEVAAGHRLPHDPFKALVAPRPIGWVSSVGASGAVNLAPYSFFNAISSNPPMVILSSEGRKDSVVFIEETREFVCNIATMDLAQEMNMTSAPLPRGLSEFTHAGLAMAESRIVKAPRVAAAHAALECRLVSISEVHDLGGRPINRWLIIGQVVGVHIEDRFLVDGLVDTAAMQPIARCGYADYAVVDKVFSIARPAGG